VRITSLDDDISFYMHENSQIYFIKTNGSSNRVFGIVFAIVFSIIACYPLLVGGVIRLWSLIVAGIFLLTALIIPDFLAPANRLWMRFGELLHRIISPIALGILFFGTVLPTGLFLRLFDKDPLRLRFDLEAESYWIKRDLPSPSAESMNNQF
jgi:hypothetical protein